MVKPLNLDSPLPLSIYLVIIIIVVYFALLLSFIPFVFSCDNG